MAIIAKLGKRPESKKSANFSVGQIGKLIRASYKGDSTEVMRALRNGLDPNALHETSGSRLLTAAIDGGHFGLVKRLLDAGSDPHLQDTWKAMPPNGTPLECACEGGSLEIAKLLIARGAEVNKRGDRTPIWAAVANGRLEIVKYLLSQGARFEPSIIMTATWSGNPGIVRALIAAGAKANYRNSDGETPLHKAAVIDVPELVGILIDAGAKVDSPTIYTKETPLHLAAQSGHIKVVKALVDAGASVTLRGWKKRTALDWAKTYGRPDVVRLLKTM